MVAGDRWVVDHNVVREVATDRAEISSFEPVLSYDEVSAPQFESEQWLSSECGHLAREIFCKIYTSLLDQG
jgi:hypothetical protein